ncbi:MAG: NB-ARC domain-containing protein [Anaerolineae bacterium]
MSHLPAAEIELEITLRSVRQALNLWDFPAKLGQTTLANLTAVTDSLNRSTQVDTLINRGLALKEQLNNAIQTLRPDGTEPQPLKREWRAYLIITERYCYGRLPEWIMVHLSISSRTFYRELNLGLGEIIAALQQAESQTQTTIQSSRPSSVEKNPTTAKYRQFEPPIPPNHPIIGREQTIQQITHGLLNEQKPLIALHGLPGVGKSTAALMMAQLTHVGERFSDGVLWVGIGPDPNLSALLLSLAQKVGISLDDIEQKDNPTEISEHIQQQIADQKLLIVIDDVWDIEAAHLFCIGGRQAAHLVTTRQLDIALTLAGPAVVSIEELSNQNSQQILKALAPELGTQSAVDLDLLYSQTGGLPLALIIFGKYLQKHGYRGQMTRLKGALARLTESQTRLDLKLDSTPFGPRTEQINLAAVIGLSTTALSADMLQHLSNLTFFAPKPNSFSQAAALSLCAGSAESLYGLVDSGLLEIVETDRYGLHPLIHDYVVVNNPRQSLPPAVKTGILDIAVSTCQQNANDFQALDGERLNIEAIIEYGLGQEIVESVSRILFDHTPYLVDRSRAQEALNWVEQTLGLAIDANNRTAEARLYFCLGLISKRKNGADAALEHFQKGRQLAADVDLHMVEFRCCVNLVELYMRNSQPSMALEIAETIRTASSSSEDIEFKAQACVSLSYVYYFHGDYQGAFELVDQAREMHEQAASQVNTGEIASIYKKLGVLSIELGRFSSASLYYDLAYERFRLLGNQGEAAHLLNNMGVLALKKGQWKRAINLHKQALEHRQSLNDQEGQGQSFLNLAVVAVTQKDIEMATSYIKQGLQLSKVSGMRYRQSLFKLLDSWLWRVRNDFTKALKTADEAFELAQELEREQTAGEAAMEQGFALSQLNRLDAAESRLTFAYKLWQEKDQQHLLAATSIYLAQVASLQQKNSLAKKHLTAGLAYLEQGVDGLDDVMDVLQISVSVLESLGDEKNAARYKQKALSYLKQQSQQIEDPAVRNFFVASFNL